MSAVLIGTPLPGRDEAMSLADLAFAVDEAGTARMLDERGAEQVRARVAPSIGPASRVRAIDVVAESRLRGDPLAGARRIRAQPDEDAVVVTAEVVTVRGADVVPLEQLSVTFVRRGGAWTAEPPRHLAS